MAEITLETVKAYADTYKAVPITVELFADVCTPIELLRMLLQAEHRRFCWKVWTNRNTGDATLS